MSTNPSLVDSIAGNALVRIPSPLIDSSFDAQMLARAETASRPTLALRGAAQLILIAHKGGAISDRDMAGIHTGRAGITHASALASRVISNLAANAAQRATDLVTTAGLDCTNEDSRVNVTLDCDESALALSNNDNVQGIEISTLTDVDAPADSDADWIATAALRAALALSRLGPMVDCAIQARRDCGVNLYWALVSDFSQWFSIVEDWAMGGLPESADLAWSDLSGHDGCDTDYEGAREDFDELWSRLTKPSFTEARFEAIENNNQTPPTGLSCTADALDARGLAPGVARYLRGLNALTEGLAPLRCDAVPMTFECREGAPLMFTVIADAMDLSYVSDVHEMSMQEGGESVVLLDLTPPNATLAQVEDKLTLCYAQVLAFEAMINHGFIPNTQQENSNAH